MRKLEAKISNNNTFGIIEEGLDPISMLLLKGIVVCNIIDNQDYKVSRNAGAFLQGFDIKSGWIFIEFWKDDGGDEFIKYANEKINNEVERKMIQCLILSGWNFSSWSNIS